MGLREFQDNQGLQWKVWSVRSETLDKRTTAEDYMRDWQDGWLCFECPTERRRLATFPGNWEELPDEELEGLLTQAQSARRRDTPQSTAEFRQFTAEASAIATAETPLIPARPNAGRLTPPSADAVPQHRAFTDPSGRRFLVAVHRLAPSRSMQAEGKVPTSPGSVLRFMSSSLTLDVEGYPDDWDRYSDAQLAQLLKRAQPCDMTSPADSRAERAAKDSLS